MYQIISKKQFISTGALFCIELFEIYLLLFLMFR